MPQKLFVEEFFFIYQSFYRIQILKCLKLQDND